MKVILKNKLRQLCQSLKSEIKIIIKQQPIAYADTGSDSIIRMMLSPQRSISSRLQTRYKSAFSMVNETATSFGTADVALPSTYIPLLLMSTPMKLCGNLCSELQK